MPKTCIAPICLRLSASPWQQLPEMAQSLEAERAGIVAALDVLEIFHMHGALWANAMGRDQVCTHRLTAAASVTNFKDSILEVKR